MTSKIIRTIIDDNPEDMDKGREEVQRYLKEGYEIFQIPSIKGGRR